MFKIIKMVKEEPRIFIAFLTTLAGLSTAIVFTIIPDIVKSGAEEETLEVRVEKLTNSLQDSASLINTIEKEIKSRSELANKLRKDINTYNELANLKKAEVEAVIQVFRGELKKESKSSLLKGVGVNFALFVLGAITPLTIQRFRYRRRKSSNKE